MSPRQIVGCASRREYATNLSCENMRTGVAVQPTMPGGARSESSSSTKEFAKDNRAQRAKPRRAIQRWHREGTPAPDSDGPATLRKLEPAASALLVFRPAHTFKDTEKKGGWDEGGKGKPQLRQQAEQSSPLTNQRVGLIAQACCWPQNWVEPAFRRSAWDLFFGRHLQGTTNDAGHFRADG